MTVKTPASMDMEATMEATFTEGNVVTMVGSLDSIQAKNSQKVYIIL